MKIKLKKSKNDNLILNSEIKSEIKAEEDSQEEEINNILNTCSNPEPKENKLKELSELLKFNPGLLGVTDPTEDEQIEEMLLNNKSNSDQDSLKKIKPLNTNPKILEALEEDLAALEKQDPYDIMTPQKLEPEKDSQKADENTNKENKEENSLKVQKEDEPSEGSFNEYSLQDEINAMAENLEASIIQKIEEEEKHENIE